MLQSGIIELDVHSMNRAQAKTYIDSQLKRAKNDIYQTEDSPQRKNTDLYSFFAGVSIIIMN